MMARLDASAAVLAVIALTAGFLPACSRRDGGAGRLDGTDTPPPPPDPTVEAVRFFRSMQFLQGFGDSPDADVANRIEEEYRREWGQPLDPDGPLFDLLLLRHDRSRVWWNDTEMDVCAENRVYERVLRAWTNISRGSFAPTDISETWTSGQGPVEVRLSLKGRSHVLRPQVADDWLDIGILADVNALIVDSGMRFTVFEPFDQTAFVVVLRDDERNRLQEARGWRFAPLVPR